MSGLVAYDALQGIDWAWLAMGWRHDQSPPWGEKGGQESDRSREDRGQAQRPHRGRRRAPRPRGGGGQSEGYDYDEVRDLLAEFGFTAHIRARGEEAKVLKQDVGFRARWWVAERTHSWMNRFRRVLIRWDKNVRNYLGFLHLVCASITYRQAGLLG
jgi:transposase